MSSPSDYFIKIAALYNDMDNQRTQNALQARRLDQYDRTLAHTENVYNDGRKDLTNLENSMYNALKAGGEAASSAPTTAPTSDLVGQLEQGFQTTVNSMKVGDASLRADFDGQNYNFSLIDPNGNTKPLTVTNSKGDEVPVKVDKSGALRMAAIHDAVSKSNPELLPALQDDTYGFVPDENGFMVPKAQMAQEMDSILRGEVAAPAPKSSSIPEENAHQSGALFNAALDGMNRYEKNGMLGVIGDGAAIATHIPRAGLSALREHVITPATKGVLGFIGGDKLVDWAYGSPEQAQPEQVKTPVENQPPAQTALGAQTQTAPEKGKNEAPVAESLAKKASEMPAAEAQKTVEAITSGKPLVRTKDLDKRAKQAAALVRYGAITAQQAENFVQHGTFSISDKDFFNLSKEDRRLAIAQDKNTIALGKLQVAMAEHQRKLEADGHKYKKGDKIGAAYTDFFKNIYNKGDYQLAGTAVESGALMYANQTGIDINHPSMVALRNVALADLAEKYKHGIKITPQDVGQTILHKSNALFTNRLSDTVKNPALEFIAPLSEVDKTRVLSKIISAPDEAGQQAMLQRLRSLPRDELIKMLNPEVVN